MVFQWRLSDSMSPQVTRTLLHFLAVLNNDVVSMDQQDLLPPSPPVPLIIFWWPYQKHQSRLLWLPSSCSIVFKIPWQGRGIYPSFLFLSVLFCGHPGQQSPQFCKFSFLLIIIRTGLLVTIRWSVCMSHRSLCVSFSRTDTGLCKYHSLLWSNLNFLQYLPVDHLAHPVLSTLIFFLGKFAAFAYYMIDGFVSITA